MSLIDEYKPKMEEAARNKSQAEPEPTPTERFYNEIYREIMDMITQNVKKAMLGGDPPPEIKHYYYRIDHSGVDVPTDHLLDEYKFHVFQDESELYALKKKLEDAIVNEIGYKYCEIKLEDKIYKYDTLTKTLFGDQKWKTLQTKGKALWIHASVNGTGFNSVKSLGEKMIYHKTRGFY